jgi:hypothetical protein
MVALFLEKIVHLELPDLYNTRGLMFLEVTFNKPRFDGRQPL